MNRSNRFALALWLATFVFLSVHSFAFDLGPAQGGGAGGGHSTDTLDDVMNRGATASIAATTSIGTTGAHTFTFSGADGASVGCSIQLDSPAIYYNGVEHDFQGIFSWSGVGFTAVGTSPGGITLTDSPGNGLAVDTGGVTVGSLSEVHITGNGGHKITLDSSDEIDLNDPVVFSSQAVAAVGTTALPGIAFPGDLDTGVWHPRANQVGVSTNALLREITGCQVSITDATASPLATVTVPTGAMVAVDLLGVVSATDGTDFQSRLFRCGWVFVNKAGTITSAASGENIVTTLTAASAGTLSSTMNPTTVDNGNGTATIKISDDSSLTSPTMTCCFRAVIYSPTAGVTMTVP